ncbi:MAG TPA: hypothetical protein VNK46_07130 [Nitrospiraceae bacterium]|nr:hypothetical protein [Nitrospiraceae bacterium]
MNTQAIRRRAALLLAMAGAWCLLFAGPAFSAGTWVEEIQNMVAFEKANNPASDFTPYQEQLARIHESLLRGDQHRVKLETDRFLRMLQERAHGISDVAADELYNFTLGVRPAEPGTTAGAIELGISNERPMSVPDHTVQTPYEGGPPCKEGGCDYWIDDVYDPGAAG